MQNPTANITREIIRHTEALVKQTYERPPIFGDSHTASYPEMLLDATIAGCLEGIKSEILARDWRLDAGEDDTSGKIAKDMTLQLKSAELPAAKENALSALWRGFLPQEQRWKVKRGTGFYLYSLADIEPDQIAFRVNDYMEVKAIISVPVGGPEQVLDTGKLWLHRHRPGRRYIAGKSILEAAYRGWYAKDQLLRLWGLNLQRFGMAHYICQVPATYTDAQYTTVREALYNLRLDGVALIPDDIAYQRHDPAFAQSISFHEAALYHDSQIKRALYLESADHSPGGQRPPTGDSMAEMGKTRRYALTVWARELTESFKRQVLQPLIFANHGEKPGLVPTLHLEGMTDTDPDRETLRIGTAAAPTNKQPSPQEPPK